MQKFDRRLVVRNNLTDLEAAVKASEAEGWALDPSVPSENSPTVLEVLRHIRAGNVGITVPMRRQVHG